MSSQTFTAENVDAAMEKAFEALGRDAIILTARFVTDEKSAPPKSFGEVVAVAVSKPERRRRSWCD